MAILMVKFFSQILTKCSFFMRMNGNSEAPSFPHLSTMFFCEISVGIIANTALLLSHIPTFSVKHRPKPTDLTIGHFALVHLVMLLTMGFITADTLGSRGLRDDIICKSVIYLYRLMRGLSFCTTCLLSVLQAVTLCLRSCSLTKLKCNSSPQSLCCFSFLCMYFSLVTFQDVFLIGLMALYSGYIMTLLCRHKRPCQHLHNTSLSPKASPEQRAIRIILLLMGLFVVMYSGDFAVSPSSAMSWNNDQKGNLKGPSQLSRERESQTKGTVVWNPQHGTPGYRSYQC
ncbi:vomeronasal type-1 receptor 90-like [Ictidomys tridecemlineatus]|nr:vomeronasal type-1 receptor 90-like [Ictidomys tridecemlineatus]